MGILSLPLMALLSTLWALPLKQFIIFRHWVIKRLILNRIWHVNNISTTHFERKLPKTVSQIILRYHWPSMPLNFKIKHCGLPFYTLFYKYPWLTGLTVIQRYTTEQLINKTLSVHSRRVYSLIPLCCSRLRCEYITHYNLLCNDIDQVNYYVHSNQYFL